MTFSVWSNVFTGMVASILLLNIIQWITYRTRIYGLYTLYMLAWLLRVKLYGDWLPADAFNFVRATSSMMAFYIYFDFADTVLNLRQRLPALYRLFPYAKGTILVYIALQAVICFALPDWNARLYGGAFAAIRALLALGGLYAVFQLLKLKDVLSRYFVAGTLFMQAGGLASQVLSVGRPIDDLSGPFWTISLAYLQVGIILELICFSLGLGHVQRRIAVGHAVMEQELSREREQRRREHLEAELSMQRLEQEKAEVHIRALQGQVNPHFLFNSLNVLDSLIEDNPGQARVFLEELSAVYRYLLRSNEQLLASLSAELAFIRSYYQLLKTRHGSGVNLLMQVDDRLLTYQLPSLTLQLLVENAVKHNIVLPEQPLWIHITTDPQGRLLVRNNVQRKTRPVISNGVGLSNILAKYQMLEQPVPVIEEVDGQFAVLLPLIGPSPEPRA